MVILSVCPILRDLLSLLAKSRGTFYFGTLSAHKCHASCEDDNKNGSFVFDWRSPFARAAAVALWTRWTTQPVKSVHLC